MLKSLDICEILKIQKNKYPLLFIDKVTKCIPGKLIISQKNFTYNEWYFPSHFEDEPNVPGFIQIESLVQSFILTFLTLEELKGKKTNFFNLDKSKFRKKIVPGDTLVITSKLNSLYKGLAKGYSEGRVDRKFACSAEFTITIPEIFSKFIPKK